MTFLENIKMALESIRANKLRSFLTMLGIIIGISSVISIVSLGQGGQNAITGEFEKIGAATINIKVNSSKAEPGDYITLDDIKQIKERVDTVKYISPMIQKQGISISENKSKRAVIAGGNEELGDVQNVEILYGRFFNEREYLDGKPVATIDDNTARTLFGYEDVVGKDIRIGPKSSAKKVTVVGVSKGFTNPFGNGEDNNMPAFVNVPITFLTSLYPSESYIDTAILTATSQNNGEEAGSSARNILESRHNNRGKDIYNMENALKQLDQINKVLGIFTAFIGAVAAISLLVGNMNSYL